MPSLFQDRQILEYSTVLGPEGDRGRQGTGVVAAFKLLCINPVANSEILINSSPIHETRVWSWPMARPSAGSAESMA